MTNHNKPEVWLRGPLPNIAALLQPVAHALLQAREEINILMTDFSDDLLWKKPAGVASPGFHLRHISGVINRLFTYAKGEMLSKEQLQYLSEEEIPFTITTAALIKNLNHQIDDAISQLCNTDEKTLTETRNVGRKQLPSTVLGLLFHAAEHTQRHTGQLMVTIKILNTQNVSD
jgi:uncharacterized damage-inducible protein DinB